MPYKNKADELAHYAANRERILARKRKYREDNKERLAIERRANYAANREKKVAEAREYRAKYPDRLRATVEKSRGKRKLQTAEYRARPETKAKRAAYKQVTYREDKNHVYLRDAAKTCLLYGMNIPKKELPEDLVQLKMRQLLLKRKLKQLNLK